MGFLFVWMILFWWWEYRFFELQPAWTVQLYFFLVVYAVTLFLMAAVLVPRSWDGVEDLGTYLIERRVSLYSLFLLATLVDLIDSYIKGGWGYVGDLGAFSLGFSAVSIPIGIIGIRSEDRRLHTVMAIVCLVFQIALGPLSLPTLGL